MHVDVNSAPANGARFPAAESTWTPEAIARQLGGNQARLTNSARGRWSTLCPCHDDRSPSLDVEPGERGILVICREGCSQSDVVAELKRRGIHLGTANNRRSKPDTSGNIASLTRHGWVIKRAYSYTDGDGTLLYENVRLERHVDGVRDGKTFRQRRPADDGWIENLNGVQRVPYRLTDIAGSTGAVHVAEGEKDADRLASLGYVATSIADPKKTDLEIFRGREVVIHADNDQPGRQNAGKRAAALAGVAASLAIVSYPDAGDGGDVSDWLDQGRGRDELEARIAEARSVDRAEIGAPSGDARDAEPTPLVRPLAPADDYPLDALGAELEAVARALGEIVQSPLAMCANTTLAAVTLAAQAHINVVRPVGGEPERPVSNLFVTIGRSGERKSATDDLAMRAVRERESDLRKQYLVEKRAWQNSHDVWDAERKSVLSRKSSAQEKRAAIDALGPEPEMPLLPILIMAEPTIEGLAKLLINGHPSVGVFSAEGGQFVGGHAMSDDAKLRSAAGLSQLWDGEAWKRVRSTDGASVIASRRVAIHLMVQPDVAAGLVNDPVLRDQGLLSRLLITFPQTTMGTRLHRDTSPSTRVIVSDFTTQLSAALSLPQPLRDGTRNELAPRRLPLSAEARLIWIEFSDHIERMIAPGELLEPVSGFAAKMGEHAARLAAVIAWWSDHQVREIGAEALKGAIRLVMHYGEEALRLYQASVVPPDIAEAQSLLKWLSTWQEPAVSIPDICQLGPNSARVARRAKQLIAILVEHGWLAPIQGGAVIRGNRRREAWSIHGRDRRCH